MAWLRHGAVALVIVASGGPALAQTVFDPLRFFAGRTHGEGVLRVIASGARGIHIDGEGIVGPDGVLTLVQRIDEDGRPERTREWSLRRTGPDRYAATLSDAIGPVRVRSTAGMLSIAFRTRDGFRIAQRLSPQAGGRVVANHLTVRRHGIRVAVLDETIRKFD